MSREIKFRAWDKEHGVMLHDSKGEFPYVSDTQFIKIVHDGVLHADTPDMGHYGGGDWSYKGGKFEIMQYTGLKDKNGKEIYEGDIVQYRSLGTQGHHWQWTRDENGKKNFGGEIKYEGYLSKGVVKYSEGSFRIDICHLHEIFRRDERLFEYRERVHGMTSKTETTYGEFEVICNIYENPELIHGT